MQTPTFTFLNHASWLLRTGGALLLVDPWLEGTVHNTDAPAPGLAFDPGQGW